MKSRFWSKEKVNNIIALLIVLLPFLIYHYEMNLGWGDDTFYLKNYDERGYFSFLSFRYNSWTSRLFIDGIVGFLVHYPLLWKVCNMFVSLIIYYYLVVILHASGKERILCALLVLLYPFEDMTSAGWIATCINYWWVLACAVAVVYYAGRYFNGKLHKIEVVFAVIALLFAVNHEQVAVLIFLFMLWLPFKHDGQIRLKIWKNRIWWGTVVLCIAAILFALTAPGNQVRMEANIDYWMPGFVDLSLFEKIYISIYRICTIFVTKANHITFLFCIVTCIVLFEKETKWIWRLIALIPNAISGVYFLRPWLHDDLDKLDRLFTFFIVPEKISRVSWEDKQVWFVTILFSIWLVALFIALLKIYSNTEMFLNEMIVPLAIGVISCVILGFSPTVWASAERTAIFMYFILIYAVYKMWGKIEHRYVKNGVIIVTAPFVCCRIVETIKIVSGM